MDTSYRLRSFTLLSRLIWRYPPSDQRKPKKTGLPQNFALDLSPSLTFSGHHLPLFPKGKIVMNIIERAIQNSEYNVTRFAIESGATGNPHHDLFVLVSNGAPFDSLIKIAKLSDSPEAAEASVDALRAKINDRGDRPTTLQLTAIEKVLAKIQSQWGSYPTVEGAIEELSCAISRIRNELDALRFAPDALIQTPEGHLLNPIHDPKMVYCAGPLFTASERDTMEAIAQELERAGFNTFVPHRDGLELAKVAPCLEERGISKDDANQMLMKAIDAIDCYQVIVRCGSLVLNASGRVPDEGGVVELSLASAYGKPTVYFKFDDSRSLVNGVDNPLVTGRAKHQRVDALKEIPGALIQEIETLGDSPALPIPLPQNIAKLVISGERLWESLTALKRQCLKDKERAFLIAQLIEDLF